MALFDGFTLPRTKPKIPSWMQEEVGDAQPPSDPYRIKGPTYIAPKPSYVQDTSAFVPPAFTPGTFDGFQLPPTVQKVPSWMQEEVADVTPYHSTEPPWPPEPSYPEPSEPMFQVKDPVGATQRAAAGRPYYTALALSQMMGGEKAGEDITVDGFQVSPTERDITVAEAPPGYTEGVHGAVGYYQPDQPGFRGPNQIVLSKYPTPVRRPTPDLGLVRFEDGSVMDPFLYNLMNTGLPYGSRTLAHEYAHHTDHDRDERTRRQYNWDLRRYRDQVLAQLLPSELTDGAMREYGIPAVPGDFRSGSFDDRLASFPGFTNIGESWHSLGEWGGPGEFFADSLPYLAQRGLGAVPAQLQQYYSPYIAPSFDPLVRNIPFSQTVNHLGSVPFQQYFGY